MWYKDDESLENFEAWSGGKDTLDVLIEKDDCDAVEQLINDSFGADDLPTKTEINDFLWFERDFIAEYLGYDSWDDYEKHSDEDDDDDNENDDE